MEEEREKEDRKKGREEGSSMNGLFDVGNHCPQTSTTFYELQVDNLWKSSITYIILGTRDLPYRQTRYYMNQHCLSDMNMKATTNLMKPS